MANLLACSKSIASLVLCVVRRFFYVPERNGNINRPTTLNTRLVGCKDSVCLQLATIISDKLFTLFTSNINLKCSPFWNTTCLINNHYSNCARMQFALEIKRFIPSLQDMLWTQHWGGTRVNWVVNLVLQGIMTAVVAVSDLVAWLIVVTCIVSSSLMPLVVRNTAISQFQFNTTDKKIGAK